MITPSLRWILRTARISAVFLLLLLLTTPVLAADYQQVVVVAQPRFGAGILNFNAQQISENEIYFSWSYAANVTGIMIRGNYGSYPDDIADAMTAPSDGFLVYSGNGTDYTYNFDENISTLYIKAWGQNVDGSWITDPDTALKESAMTFLAFFGTLLLASIGLTGFMFYSKNSMLGFPCLILWSLTGGICYLFSSSETMTTYETILKLMGFAFLFLGIFAAYAAFAIRKRELSPKKRDWDDSVPFVYESRALLAQPAKATQEQQETAVAETSDMDMDINDSVSNDSYSRRAIRDRAAARRGRQIKRKINWGQFQ